MRKLLLAALLILSPLTGWAATPPPYLGAQIYPSSATYFITGNVCVAASTQTAGTCTVNVNGVTKTLTASTGTFTNINGDASNVTNVRGGNVTGSVATATALATTPTKCSAGNYPLGVDTGGNAQNCTAAGIGDVTQAGNNTFKGTNIFLGTTQVGPTTFSTGTPTITIALSSGTWGNGWTVVGSTYIVNAPSVIFTNLVSSTTYRMYTQSGENAGAGTTAQWLIRFSTSTVLDAASVYYQAGVGDSDGSGINASSQGSSATACTSQHTTATVATGDAFNFALGPFRTGRTNQPGWISSRLSAGGERTNPHEWEENIVCQYKPTTANHVNTVGFVPPSGWTGYIFLEQLTLPYAQ
jgi:hypothetical protein